MLSAPLYDSIALRTLLSSPPIRALLKQEKGVYGAEDYSWKMAIRWIPNNRITQARRVFYKSGTTMWNNWLVCSLFMRTAWKQMSYLRLCQIHMLYYFWNQGRIHNPALLMDWYHYQMWTSRYSSVSYVLLVRLWNVSTSLVFIDPNRIYSSDVQTQNFQRLFSYLQFEQPGPQRRSVNIKRNCLWFSWLVLKCKGFVPIFPTWISLQYTIPKVALKIGTSLATFFLMFIREQDRDALYPWVFLCLWWKLKQ